MKQYFACHLGKVKKPNDLFFHIALSRVEIGTVGG